jgi:hypothetical protein
MTSLRGKNQGITGFNDFTELIGKKGNDRSQRGTVWHAALSAEAMNGIEHIKHSYADGMSMQKAQIIGVWN